jgi:hypothetical protein
MIWGSTYVKKVAHTSKKEGLQQSGFTEVGSAMVQLCTGSGGQCASSVVVTCYVGKQVEQGEAMHVSASDSTGCKATSGPCQEYRCPPTDHAQRMSAPKIVTMPQKASCADVWTKFVGKCQMCLQDVARREELTGVQKTSMQSIIRQ